MAKAGVKPKGDKREHTRTALIEAAARVIAEKGYERMSLADVATRAGMTRGAIYGNFADKEDLVLAVMRRGWRPVSVMPAMGSTFREQMRLSGEALVAAMPDRQKRARQAVAFQLYALGHDEIRRRFAELNDRVYERMSETLTANFRGEEMPMPAAQLVRALHALSDGLVIARALNPKDFTDDVILAAFEAFANLPAKRKQR